MKPFLLLAIRAEDAAADNEYDSFLTMAGLEESELRRVRLEQRALGDVDLRDWSGIMLGGGPFNYTDPADLKTPVQRRVEADLSGLLDRVVSADFPFLGACYGIGALGCHQGAEVDRRFAEPVGAVEITLTPPGRRDPLLGELPRTFQAFTGHKEAISRLPGHAILLARPVHPGGGLQARRLLRPRPGRRDQGAGHPQPRQLAARHLARVRRAVRSGPPSAGPGRLTAAVPMLVQLG